MKLKDENMRLLEMSKQLGSKGFSNNPNGINFKAGSGVSQARQSIADSNNSKFPKTTSRDAFNDE